MKIEGTKQTPTVEFDEGTGKLKIYGISIAINPSEFWDQVIDMVEIYLEDPKDLELDINLEYFNTPSASKLYSLLKFIDNRMGEVKKKRKRKFTVVWHDDNDEDMRETGDDLSSMVSKNTTWVFKP